MNKILIILITIVTMSACLGETLDLQTCIEKALANNPDIQKAGYALQQSKINTRQAWSELYPGVSASATTGNSGPFVSDVNDNWDWTLSGSVSQQIYRPGMFSGIKLAKVRQLSSEQYQELWQNQIRAAVENVYYQILTSDTLVGVYKANIELSEEQIVKMRTMVELGLKRESDLLKSVVQRGTFEAQLVREYQSLASSKRSMNILMGRSPEVPFVIEPLSVDQVDLPELQSAYAVMQDHNPTLKQLQSQINAQKLTLAIYREAYLPSLSGSYSYSKSNDVFGGPAVESDRVSLRLSLDIFDGFTKSRNVQLGKLGLEEAQLDYDATVRDLNESLANQYSALQTQNQLISIHQTNLASARKDLQVVMEQYAAGFSSILDLTDAQVSVLESETNLLRDLYSRKQIEAEIKRLLGI